MKDEDLMPAGKYKGTKMKDIPAPYLLTLIELNIKMPKDVKKYIEDNRDVLEIERKNSTRYK